METRDQKYAKAAFPKVSEKKATDTRNIEAVKLEKSYRTVALNFPVMILQSGLTQSIGFLLAKNKAEHQAYLQDLADILGLQNAKKLHETIIGCNLSDYQQHTRKALEASAWLKRYTQALLKGD